MNENVKQKKKEIEFYEQFGKRVNDKVESVIFTRLIASRDVLETLGLSLTTGQEDISGVFVICTKSLFFFVPSTELAIMGVRVTGGKYETTFDEQLLAFSSLKKWKASDEPKKSFFSRLFSIGIDGDIMISFTSVDKKNVIESTDVQNSAIEKTMSFWLSFNDKKKINADFLRKYSEAQ